MNEEGGVGEEGPLTRKERERQHLLNRQREAARLREEQGAQERVNLGKPANVCSSLVLDGEGVGLRLVGSLDAARLEKGSLPLVAYLPGDNPGGPTAGSGALELQALALDRLLRMSHSLFWCHVLHDSRLAAFVESYLRYASRAFDAAFVLYSGSDLRSLVFQRVFLVLLRASSARESKDFFLEPAFHEEWLRSPKSWFDMPRLLDICSLYSAANGKALAGMVKAVFSANSKLYEELQKCAGVLIQTADKAFVSTKAGVSGDRELFLVDSLCSLHAVVTALPRAARQLHGAGMLSFVARCFAHHAPLILIEARRRRVQRLCAWLAFSMIEQAYLERVFERGSNKFQAKVGAEFLASLRDLDCRSALMQMVERHHQLGAAIRKMVSRGSGGLSESEVEEMCCALEEASGAIVSGPTAVPAAFAGVDEILDVLPDLGRPFVEACLSHMNGDAAALLNALLTDSLPEQLAGLDRRTGKPPSVQEAQPKSSGKGKEEADDDDDDDDGVALQGISVPLVDFGSACMQEEIAEESATIRLQVGKRAFAAELPEVDHEMRAFISRYADSYNDEYDDSFAVHADLAMEPLAEDEAEELETEARPVLPDTAAGEPHRPASAGRGRGGGGPGQGGGGNTGPKKKGGRANRKKGNMKKTGVLIN